MVATDGITNLLRLIDSVIVLLLLAGLVRYLRGSMLPRMLWSLAVVAALFFLADHLRFPMLRSLTMGILNSLPLILVVIFQHDIRKWLASATVTGSRRLASGDELIGALVTASLQLSTQRIGALIVLQRDTPLGHLVDVGTEIDAKVTAELLTSIFFPYSPIHDGAVIIQNGKLTRAGCLLPLSQEPSLSKVLGTRHRAAIGLSELVDALVIVVSEETGQVSFVQGGKCQRLADPHDLERLLRKHLASHHLGLSDGQKAQRPARQGDLS
jgi:uncharacterized protein (TIGR00159 family)